MRASRFRHFWSDLDKGFPSKAKWKRRIHSDVGFVHEFLKHIIDFAKKHASQDNNHHKAISSLFQVFHEFISREWEEDWLYSALTDCYFMERKKLPSEEKTKGRTRQEIEEMEREFKTGPILKEMPSESLMEPHEEPMESRASARTP